MDKNNMKYILTIFFAMSMASSFCQAGWEVSGGDSYALQFVKIGRVLAEQMPKNPACTFREGINLSEFRQAIESSEVSTVNQDTPSIGNKIYVNRLSWPNLSNDKKTILVLKAYSMNSASQFNGSFTEDQVYKCATAVNSVKIFPPHGAKRFDPPLPVSKDIAVMAKELLSRLSNAPDADVLKHFEFAKLKSAVDQVSIGTAPIALKFTDSQIKDGLNFKDQQSASLLINKSTWRRMNRGQRMELLLHEYLSVIGSNDKHYQISSLLFRDLPSQDYLR